MTNLPTHTLCGFLLALGFSMACSGADPDPNVKADARLGESLVVSDISPAAGTLLGGTSLTITGDGFAASDRIGVLIGDRLATDVEVIDENTLELTSPEGRGGTVDVTVFGNAGYGLLAEGYRYFDGPVITSVSPPFAGNGTEITITGSGFVDDNAGDPVITIGTSTTCINENLVSDEEVRCTIERGSDEANFVEVNLELENNNGAAQTNFALSGAGLYLASGPAQFGAVGTGLFYLDPDAEVATLTRIGTVTERIHSMVPSGPDTLLALVKQSAPNGTMVDINLADGTMVERGVIADQEFEITDMSRNLTTIFVSFRGNDITQPRLATLNPNTLELTTLPASNNIPDRIRCLAVTSPIEATLISSRETDHYTANLNTGVLTNDGNQSEQDFASCRSLTSYNGKIYGIRRGRPDLAPPPPGKGEEFSTVFEYDSVTQVWTDIIEGEGSLHAITGVGPL